jgi:hypothetical protein
MTVATAWCLAGAAIYADGPLTTFQTANLNMFMTTTPTPGGATLYRGKQSLEARVAAGGLQPHTTYTVWWVIFNNPGACVGGCGLDDLSRPDVRASVLYAAGFVTGSGDTGNVDAHLSAGTLPAGTDVQLGTGLEDGAGYRAVVHVILRTHGATIPGIVEQQIGSFGGGCSATCMNVQAAEFAAVGS